MYIDYELMGGSVSVLGLPVAARSVESSGFQQRFAGGLLYYRNGSSNAFEVHGDILQKYLSTGGADVWGFPTTNEIDVLDSVSHTTIGRQNQFERCTILWSTVTDAHIIYGAIRDTYNSKGGPGQPISLLGLGFPTSDEADIPGVGGFARYNTFQNGSILFYNGSTVVASPFQFRLGNLSTQEDEGWGQGQNDLYVFIDVVQNGINIFHDRQPNSGSWEDDNSHDLSTTLPPVIVPNDVNLSVQLSVDVWDEDDGFGGSDDHIGTLNKILNISNGWGLFDNSFGVFQADNIDEINSLDWAIWPIVPPGTPKDFWGVANQSTPYLTYRQYGLAFNDIDDDPEWSDPSDWVQENFYSDTIQGAANGGNCFGMCVEALDSWVGNSLFSIPLARFTNWNTIVDNVNIHQIYWFGSDCLWFADDQIRNANLSPADVFRKSRASADSGNPAIIYMFSNSNFSGTGHAVLPTAWDDTVTPWKMTVFDPNGLNVQTTVSISPTSNAFSFNNAGLTFGGSPGTGSIGYIPFSCVNHRQASPSWDPTLLILLASPLCWELERAR